MNRLAGALSPYLLQHAANPVDWWPWGEEALAEAKRRDVPLLVSVGYAACHWCHVMAHESFEDEEVAAAVNAVTVPIKVDREERPDVDAVYMQATLALTGQGGWPMTVFATPDGTPFFAGTYFPRDAFVELVEAVGRAWRDHRSELLRQGEAVVTACARSVIPLADVTQVCPIDGPCPPVPPVPRRLLDTNAATVRGFHDPVNGGFGSAPKFPNQPMLAFLHEHSLADGDGRDPDDAAVVEQALERMARGGIYDQLAGGFARYSVDAHWTVPHFEKMLYDNALLLDSYHRLAEVADGTRRALFTRIAAETTGFVLDELVTPQGGFAAALDADTEGVEGATYVWTPDQLRDVLGPEDAAEAAALFGVGSEPNFEAGASVLRLPADPADPERHRDLRTRLAAARAQRPRPARDDKVVAAWNGMAVTALTRYAAGTGDTAADAAADRAARLLAELHLVDGRLRRVSRDGVVGSAGAVLEDHGAVAAAFLARHAATSDPVWRDRAATVLDLVVDHFVDPDTGGFRDTADDATDWSARPADPADGPTPSGWALAADALADFARRFGVDSYQDVAWRALAAAEVAVRRQPRFTAGIATVALRWQD